MRALVCLALASAGCMGLGDAPVEASWADQAVQIARGVHLEECGPHNMQVQRVHEPAENQTPPEYVNVNVTSYIGDGPYPMVSFPLAVDGCIGVAGLARAQHQAGTGLIHTARSQQEACWWSGSGGTPHTTTGILEVTLTHKCVHFDFGTDGPSTQQATAGSR